MESERKAFSVFMGLHAHKACPVPGTPCVYLQFHSEGMNPNASLIRFTKEDVMEEFDTDAELVRYLLHQMSTYDCYEQRIVALAFDRSTILSDVLRMPS